MAHSYVTVGEKLEVFRLLLNHIAIEITVTSMTSNRRIPTDDARPATRAVEVASTSDTSPIQHYCCNDIIRDNQK